MMASNLYFKILMLAAIPLLVHNFVIKKYSPSTNISDKVNTQYSPNTYKQLNKRLNSLNKNDKTFKNRLQKKSANTGSCDFNRKRNQLHNDRNETKNNNSHTLKANTDLSKITVLYSTNEANNFQNVSNIYNISSTENYKTAGSKETSSLFESKSTTISATSPKSSVMDSVKPTSRKLISRNKKKLKMCPHRKSITCYAVLIKTAKPSPKRIPCKSISCLGSKINTYNAGKTDSSTIRNGIKHYSGNIGISISTNKISEAHKMSAISAVISNKSDNSPLEGTIFPDRLNSISRNANPSSTDHRSSVVTRNLISNSTTPVSFSIRKITHYQNALTTNRSTPNVSRTQDFILHDKKSNFNSKFPSSSGSLNNTKTSAIPLVLFFTNPTTNFHRTTTISFNVPNKFSTFASKASVSYLHFTSPPFNTKYHNSNNSLRNLKNDYANVSHLSKNLSKNNRIASTKSRLARSVKMYRNKSKEIFDKFSYFRGIRKFASNVYKRSSFSNESEFEKSSNVIKGSSSKMRQLTQNHVASFELNSSLSEYNTYESEEKEVITPDSILYSSSKSDTDSYEIDSEEISSENGFNIENKITADHVISTESIISSYDTNDKEEIFGQDSSNLQDTKKKFARYVDYEEINDNILSSSYPDSNEFDYDTSKEMYLNKKNENGNKESDRESTTVLSIDDIKISEYFGSYTHEINAKLATTIKDSFEKSFSYENGANEYEEHMNKSYMFVTKTIIDDEVIESLIDLNQTDNDLEKKEHNTPVFLNEFNNIGFFNTNISHKDTYDLKKGFNFRKTSDSVTDITSTDFHLNFVTKKYKNNYNNHRLKRRSRFSTRKVGNNARRLLKSKKHSRSFDSRKRIKNIPYPNNKYKKFNSNRNKKKIPRKIKKKRLKKQEKLRQNKRNSKYHHLPNRREMKKLETKTEKEDSFIKERKEIKSEYSNEILTDLFPTHEKLIEKTEEEKDYFYQPFMLLKTILPLISPSLTTPKSIEPRNTKKDDDTTLQSLDSFKCGQCCTVRSTAYNPCSCPRSSPFAKCPRCSPFAKPCCNKCGNRCCKPKGNLCCIPRDNSCCSSPGNLCKGCSYCVPCRCSWKSCGCSSFDPYGCSSNYYPRGCHGCSLVNSQQRPRINRSCNNNNNNGGGFATCNNNNNNNNEVSGTSNNNNNNAGRGNSNNNNNN